MSPKNNQKPSLKTNFLLRLASLCRNGQTGFTLYTGIALCLVAAAGTTLALAKANKDQSNITSNQGARQALAITNGGINKSLAKFSEGNNAYLLLGKYDYNSNTGKYEWTFQALEDAIKVGGTASNYNPPANACEGSGTNITFTDNLLDYVKSIAQTSTLVADIQAGTVGQGKSKGTYKFEYYSPVVTLPSNVTSSAQSIKADLRMEGQNSTKTENTGQYLASFNINIQTPLPTNAPTGAAAVIGESIDVNGMTMYTNTAICTEPGSLGCTNGYTITGCGSDAVLSSSNTTEYTQLQSLLGGTTGSFVAPNTKDNTNILIQSFTIPRIPIVKDTDKIVNIDVIGKTMYAEIYDAKCDFVPINTDPNKKYENIAKLHDDCFKDKFVKTKIDGKDYFLLNIIANNFPQTNGDQGELGFQINETELEKISFTDPITNNVTYLDVERLIIRVYIPQTTVIFKGNAAVSVVDDKYAPLTGATEKERAILSSIRLIAGQTNGTSVTADWNMSGTSCFIGQIHGPDLSISLPQGNGCDSIKITDVVKNDYNITPTNLGNTATPNVYGTIWAKSITNSSQGASGAFYENTSLSEYLYAEYKNGYPTINGQANQTKVSIQSPGLTGLIRQDKDTLN